MTTTTRIFTPFEDGSCFLMDRIYGNAGTAITQATISAIAYKITRMDTETVTTASTALTVSAVVFDTLQTDARWTEDTVGYNFGWLAPAAAFAEGGIMYNVDITFTPTSGGSTYNFCSVFKVETVKRYN